MKDRQVTHGTYLGGSARQLKIAIRDQIQTLEVSDVARIEFGGDRPVAEAAPPAPEDQRQERRTEANDPPPQPAGSGITLPAGPASSST